MLAESVMNGGVPGPAAPGKPATLPGGELGLGLAMPTGCDRALPLRGESREPLVRLAGAVGPGAPELAVRLATVRVLASAGGGMSSIGPILNSPRPALRGASLRRLGDRTGDARTSGGAGASG